MWTVNDMLYAEQVEEAERELWRGAYILITAPLRSGVTSFLHLLQDRLAEKYPNWNVVYVELPHGADMAGRLDEVMQTSLPSLIRFGEPYGCSKGCCFVESTNVMRVINASSNRVVVILDGFHRVDQEQQKGILQQLRQTYYQKDTCKRLQKLNFVLGGAIDLDKIDPTKNSPFFANTTIRLADWTFNESKFFVHEFFSKKQKSVPESIILYLYDMTEGHPYLLTTICQRLYGRSKGEHDISLWMAQSTVEEMLERRDEYFDILNSEIRRADTLTIDLLVRILGGSLVNESQNPILKELLRLGLVKIVGRNGRSYIKMRNPMVERFVRGQTSTLKSRCGGTVAPIHEITIATPTLSEYHYRLFAQTQHLLRNFIVCKLYAHYGSGWSEKVDQRVMEQLRELRISDPSGLPDQPLLGYANLEQLQQLIVAEWSSVFQKHFGETSALNRFFEGLSLLSRKTSLGQELTEYDMAKVESMTQYFYQFMDHRSLIMTKDEVFQPKLPLTLLFLAANPTSTPRLDLEQEIHEIDQRLRLAEKERNSFRIEQSWAPQYLDLQDALQRYSPNIVHFSGHGNKEGQIVIRGGKNDAHAVPIEALARLLGILKRNIRCVVLNACWSDKQAEAIAQEIDCVVGMSRAISDGAAVKFAAGFYQALGYGSTVQEAFDLGRNAIAGMNIPGDATPQLRTRTGVSAASIRFA